ncbi:ABC transporter permease [Telmatospirillum sp. J64-1]|uniref:ABC transporter permease n=1 Tax=Telmatospirillum sp. J64-1 TaxID=2502183 RepID=UPI00115DE857|nr:ABC transporter permease [Telmatospirillum sp. J64-1]
MERFFAFLKWTIGLAAAIYLMAPLVVIVLVSFSSSSFFALPPPEWSFRWYERAWGLRGLWDALALSVQIAAISTALSLVLGTLCALGLVRGHLPGRDAIANFMVSPLMMPGLVLGVAMLQFLRDVGLRDAWWSLLIAHVVITMPFVVRTLMASLSAFNFSLLDAAQTLGMSFPRAVVSVMIPVLAPAFLTSGLFAFLASMDNYPISMFLTDARNKTLPIQMLQYIEESPDPTIAAISSGLILLAIIVLVVTSKAVGLRRMVDM